MPERLPEFVSAYKEERRKEITAANYTISDYLGGLVVGRADTPVFDTSVVFVTKMLRQVALVKAAIATAPSTLRDIKTILRAEIMDSDIHGARELVSAGYLRAAGVVAGVVLETHLKGVCSRRSIAVRKKNATIADFNDTLKEAKVYDTPTWRHIQRLGDIRNLCGHAKDREPTEDEVSDLIGGTDKTIKEVF